MQVAYITGINRELVEKVIKGLLVIRFMSVAVYIACGIKHIDILKTQYRSLGIRPKYFFLRY